MSKKTSSKKASALGRGSSSVQAQASATATVKPAARRSFHTIAKTKRCQSRRCFSQGSCCCEGAEGVHALPNYTDSAPLANGSKRKRVEDEEPEDPKAREPSGDRSEASSAKSLGAEEQLSSYLAPEREPENVSASMTKVLASEATAMTKVQASEVVVMAMAVDASEVLA
ncbi:hypothetical protein GUJ93_ZPchr0015g6762 [Zizania palustris]|uniref:Uncharacterized protein n=1 Tax=Zizania palustris TaxID=103762 RepID=A0A8J5SYD2_ZIZPA|nr:hypothetical protein GUJ93_ZPchr0015g6762 [Zizania palustris]